MWLWLQGCQIGFDDPKRLVALLISFELLPLYKHFKINVAACQMTMR